MILLLSAVVPVVTAQSTDVEVDQSLRLYPTALLIRDEAIPADEDERFRELSQLREATGTNTYLTSAARSGRTESRIIVSTTFHGLYESKDGGVTWTHLEHETSPVGDALYFGSGFYEDISAVGYDVDDPDVLWIERAQTGDLSAYSRSTGVRLDLSAERGRRSIARTVRAPEPERADADSDRAARRESAADHISFYLSARETRPERLAAHMEFAAEQGMTAVVIDFKDDFGRITYDSALEMHREVGAVRAYFDAERVIETVRSHGLYLIARIVVFKDRELYAHDNYRYALWDRTRDEPWGVFRTETNEETGEEVRRQVEHWVDLFSEDVWDYNIAIARELEELGVDEIQFDYIRTPADGRVRDIEFRYRDMNPAIQTDRPHRDDRVEGLSAFLQRARDALTIPIGIDVFGFNGWYRMSYLGQDIAILSRYVDVISPMLYPSHFPRDFRGEMPYLEWSEFLYREGVARGRRITADGVLIRPYIQSFLIGGELSFEEPTYTDYLKHQIRGSIEAGASGFTLWNFSGRYYMVSRGLWFDGDAPTGVGGP